MAGIMAAEGISCMEVVPALVAEYLDAFREAGDSLACLKYILTGEGSPMVATYASVKIH
jgi:hypothetical protein